MVTKKYIEHKVSKTVPEHDETAQAGTVSDSNHTASGDVGFASRIDLLIKRYDGPGAFARKVNVSEAVVRKWRNAKSDPSRGYLVAIADAFGLSMDWLVSGRGPMFAAEKAVQSSVPRGVWDEFELVPLYDVRLSAGAGAFLNDEEIKSHIAFRKDWLRQQGWKACDLVGAIADGDSMEKTIDDGDVLIINRAMREPLGDFIYAIRISNELRVKRLQRLLDGSIQVSSDNKIYTDEVISPNNLHQLHILGRVVWIGGCV